ncbi:MAG TPA: helix-turn-helix transcriptional regulator, partial [Sphingomonas sp.]|nr:helix-turn-helix transcriptional regulator [Sphingomonas sp.]
MRTTPWPADGRHRLRLMGPHHDPASFAAALAKLSERQRAALRLVARGHDSKTIAPQFGRSHHTIHKDLERAMNLLGARDRFEAARWLVDFEGERYEA